MRRESGGLTCTEHVAAITPSTGDSEKGSNVLSGLLMKSGLSKYLSRGNHKLEHESVHGSPKMAPRIIIYCHYGQFLHLLFLHIPPNPKMSN